MPQEPERRCGELLRLLLQRLNQSTAAPLTRSAAAAYAGSFLARAAFLPQPLLAEAIQVSTRSLLRQKTSKHLFPLLCQHVSYYMLTSIRNHLYFQAMAIHSCSIVQQWHDGSKLGVLELLGLKPHSSQYTITFRQ